MDRNSLIGFTLMALLLFVYFTFFAPQPVPPQTTAKTDSLSVISKNSGISLPNLNESSFTDSTFIEETTTLENSELIVTISNLGGRIVKAELKNYKAYGGGPLLLIDSGSSRFKNLASINGREIDLFSLPYQTTTKNSGESKTLELSAVTKDGANVSQTWTLPSSGFVINYKAGWNGAQNQTLRFSWVNDMPLVEKDLNDSRSKTAINFFLNADGIDGLQKHHWILKICLCHQVQPG